MPYLILLVLCLFSISFAETPKLLKRSDIRPAIDEMLQYHVEYKTLSPQLVRRSIKLYLEQFDPEKIYLLSSEVAPYLNLSNEELVQCVKDYEKGGFAFFERLSEIIERAVVRSRVIRQTIGEDLIGKKISQEKFLSEIYTVFSSDEMELKHRVQNHLLRTLKSEEKVSQQTFGQEELRKVVSLWETRLRRQENTYLRSEKLRTLSSEKIEHTFALHVLKAMPKSLDAHSAYFSPQEAWEMRSSLEKQFEGIGVILREGIDGVRIVGLVASGPAERSGKIKPGDLLVSVDGHSLQGEPYEKVLTLLQGNGSKSIHLVCERFTPMKGTQRYEVILPREKIVMQNDRVQYASEPFADGIIGKIVLPSFYESMDGLSCDKDMRDALKALKAEGKLYGIVLDLRDNSGGFLSQAVKVAGLFISSGVVVISKYARGKVQYLRTIDGRSYYNGPLVILTSRGSASAAEIVAQALQDYGVGLVVGDDRTYGKGTIQYQTVTDASASTFFKVTVGRYYTVSGRSTQIDGVEADIIVPTILSAYPIGERYLEYPLNNDRVPSAYVDMLVDIDGKNLSWFQKNYLPTLQKKLSIWTQMKPQLIQNSAERVKNDPDYALFLQALSSQKGKPSLAGIDFGAEDLQMKEGVCILKDMIFMQAELQAQ